MINNIWYCHPYAGGPGFGNSARAFHMASCWQKYHRQVTVFSASWHHLMGAGQSFSGSQMFEGVRYVFVSSRPYAGNGLSRLRNMLDYCIGLARNAEDYAERFGRPDVIVVSSPHPYAILVCLRLARRWGARLIFEVRDLWPLSLTELAGVSVWHPLALFTGWVERFAYRHADACVSLLPGAEAHMRERGLLPGRFHYIPNGVLSNPSSPASSGVMDGSAVLEYVQMLRDKGCFIVIYPGAMGPPNNMLPLIEAAQRLALSGDASIQFVLMGQGGDVDRLKHRVEALALQNVHFFPQARRGVALAMMRLASVGYVSVRRLSIYRHGISFNKLFEYMQQELPVVFAADVPGNPVELSGCGVVTSPDEPEIIADAIRELATRPLPTLNAMGHLGKQYVEKFHDYDVLAQSYLDVFDCCL